MNPLAIARGALWLATFVFLAAAAARLRISSMADVAPSAAHLSDRAESPSPMSTDSLNTLADRIVNADLFRLARRPAQVAFGAGDGSQMVAPKPPKPPLALSGVIGGPPWTGLLDGVPGHDQSVLVHAGDTLGGLRVRSVSRNGIVVTGLDTAWQLTVHDPWH